MKAALSLLRPASLSRFIDCAPAGRGEAAAAGQRQDRMRSEAESALAAAGRLIAADQPPQALARVRLAARAAALLGAAPVVSAAGSAAQAIEDGDLDAALFWLARACVALACCSIAMEDRLPAPVPAAPSAGSQRHADRDGALQIDRRRARAQFDEELLEETGIH